MLSLIRGTTLKNDGNKILVMTSGGIGFEIAVNPLSAQKILINQEIEIPTYLIVRENAMELFGFCNDNERSLFEKFLTVSGIGPKTALHLLSAGTIEEIVGAISRGDSSHLTRVNGIGTKTAERIVVELKSTIHNLKIQSTTGVAVDGNLLGDVIDGLITMGYSAIQAREAVRKLDPKEKSGEQLLREALQIIK